MLCKKIKNLFRKKNEAPIPVPPGEERSLSESEIKILKRLSFLRDYMNEMQHDLLLGKISSVEYVKEENDMIEKLDELCESLGEEKESYHEQFDQMMGEPIQWLDEIFNQQVHEAVEDCERKEDDRGI